jgi:hypothetical protein
VRSNRKLHVLQGISMTLQDPVEPHQRQHQGLNATNSKSSTPKLVANDNKSWTPAPELVTSGNSRRSKGESSMSSEVSA